MSFTIEHWDNESYAILLAHLKEISDKKYRDFHSRLVPNKENILGVRLPQIQATAKEIVKGNWREFLSIAGDNLYEEVMLQGLVIGLVKTDIDEVIKFTTNFIPKIDNWAVCDSFCTGLKITKKNPEKMFEFICGYLSSDREYNLRFASVMLLCFYINDEYIDRVLKIYDNIHHDGYYVKMAVAWGLSVGVVKCSGVTIKYLQSQNQIDKFTYNKAIQKAIESYRVPDETKTLLRGIKQ
ncbi:MAG: DNA alkylation repair protein [Oscillospiraceae bacterium]